MALNSSQGFARLITSISDSGTPPCAYPSLCGCCMHSMPCWQRQTAPDGVCEVSIGLRVHAVPLPSVVETQCMQSGWTHASASCQAALG